MTTRIDVTKAPPPVPGPFASLLLAIGAAVLFGFMMLFPIGFLMWPIAALFPSLGPDRIAAALGLSGDEFVFAILFPISALVWFAALLAMAIAAHRWRAPVYGIRMGALCAKLRRFRRNLPGALGRGRVWGALNIAAAFALLFSPVMLRSSGASFADYVPEQWRAQVFAVAVVIVFGGFLFLLLNGARLIAGRSTASRYFTSLFLRAAPFVTFILFLCAGMMLGLVASGPRNLDGGRMALCLLGAAVAGFFTMRWLDARLSARAHAMALPHAKDALWSDRRRPVLFLRSFKDDAAIASGTGAREPVDPEQITRLEDVLANVARRYGPLIAVGEPGVLPREGAARAYYDGEDWREAVQAWQDQALFILMIAGWTEGLRWELDTAIARGHARKLILIFPPNDRNFEPRWEWVQDRLGKIDMGAQMRAADRSGALALHLDSQGHLVVLHSADAVTSNYQTALALALYGMFRNADGELALTPR
jgi:hypothetical protein